MLGLTDFVMARSGAATGETDSVAVTALVSPAPVTVTVLVTESSLPLGVNSFVVVSYIIVAFPPAGTEIPVSVSGAAAPTAGAATRVPLV